LPIADLRGLQPLLTTLYPSSFGFCHFQLSIANCRFVAAVEPLLNRQSAIANWQSPKLCAVLAAIHFQLSIANCRFVAAAEPHLNRHSAIGNLAIPYWPRLF
jgi:hypothetical protein